MKFKAGNKNVKITRNIKRDVKNISKAISIKMQNITKSIKKTNMLKKNKNVKLKRKDKMDFKNISEATSIKIRNLIKSIKRTNILKKIK